MPSGSYAILTLTVVSTGALPANRFVTQQGQLPAAGGRVLGCSRYAADKANESLAVDVQGTTVAECGAAVTVDTVLTTDAQGRVIPTSAGKIPVGLALEAGVLGAPIEILLVPTLSPSV